MQMTNDLFKDFQATLKVIRAKIADVSVKVIKSYHERNGH